MCHNVAVLCSFGHVLTDNATYGVSKPGVGQPCDNTAQAHGKRESRSQTCGLLTTSTPSPKDMESQLIFGFYDELGNLFLWPAKNTVVVHFMLSLDPGNLRLNSGSLSAGWFPLPDAVRGLLGCHPSVPPLSVFVDLRAALGHVDCCARSMRAVVGD